MGQDLPEGEGRAVLCIGGRGAIDDAAASMISQVLAVQGATVSQADHTAVSGRGLNLLTLNDIDAVLITFLNAGSKAHARQIVRRLKRLKPLLRVGVFMPSTSGSGLLAAEDIDADFVSSNITGAVRGALTQEEAIQVKVTTKRISRSGQRKGAPLGV
jgi:hypothetical protein